MAEQDQKKQKWQWGFGEGSRAKVILNLPVLTFWLSYPGIFGEPNLELKSFIKFFTESEFNGFGSSLIFQLSEKWETKKNF